MFNIRRHQRLFLAASALVIAVPLGVSLAQNAPKAEVDKVPPGPTPLHAPMPPLSPEEILKRQGRGGGGGGAADYNVSRRSDFDKALPNPYVVNQTWYTMPKGRYIGGASAIDMDRDGVSIWVMERCGTANDCEGSHVDPIMKFSPDGKIQIMFGKDMINYPHGMYVDLDNNIWVTDTVSNIDRFGANRPVLDFSKAHPAGAQVLKFSPTGQLLLRLGTPGVYGNDATHFSQPSDVVTDAQGNIYVADGHDSPPANNRIVKFDKTGKFIKSWGSCMPWHERQIDCGHSINIDSQGRILVSNRANDMIDVFDQEGKLLAEWPNWGKSSGLYIDKNDIMYSSDSQSGNSNRNAFMKGVHIGSAKTGEITAFIPDPLGNSTAWQPGGTLSPEGVAVDKDGRVYTSSVRPPGLMRWTLTENTPPVRLFNPGGGRGGNAGGGRAGAPPE